ncbi:autotransporter outer membrane beta-barrel domain-containing protein [Bartonella alsatica]|uniref:Outer membrane autotransporter barrel domain-containing protein n=2 Tax=Bartonella alsatica TaxID=52764 RepID=J0Q0G2_9HYPH|nr:autotransporter outer membrane beta-barrel domain-containing protein [Bartonella alsatica]EJF76004.1 outer membrane autotransporter barrel domain-containing protein [Bartonella alsatica IBS 382]QLC51754.1 autotransporter outer membrane beta-barrel domain-containing protein [Bartonella alsatica]
MINVFCNHIFLSIFIAIAAVFHFLQIVNVKASDTLCSPDAQFYTCSDGQKHTIQNKVYHLENYQGDSPESAPIAAIYVKNKGTILDASQITVLGNNLEYVSAYGAYVRDGGTLNLIDSNFKGVPGLRAQNGEIQMTNGSIGGTTHAIYASGKKADIALVTVNIKIEPDDMKVKGVGIISGFNAIVRMSDSTVTFEENGSFSTRFGGRYLLDTTMITGKGKKERIKVSDEDNDYHDKFIDRLPEAFEVEQAGNVHLRNNIIQLTDMHGFLIKNFSGFADANGKLVQEYASSNVLKNTEIKLEKTTISVQGEGARGLYFDSLGPKELVELVGRDEEKLLKTKSVITGKAFVYLSQSTLTVPDGVAIYVTETDGNGVVGTIELSKETKISGDLLLKAENNSSISIKASDSSLTGGTRVEDISTVDLQLTNGSTWFLTQSKYKGSQESDSTDSSISSVALSDSTIVFNKNISDGYQTLRIGKKTVEGYINDDGIESSTLYDETEKLHKLVDKKAYSAQGNVQIKLSAFLKSNGLFDSQKTDRVLIYGDVSGTTFVDMQNSLKISETEMENEGEGSESVSLIQVSGIAQEGSFKLLNEYVTVNGLPYQYSLRGYGPGSSFGEADPKNRLVAGDGKFWDFRLEGVYDDPEPDSSEVIPSIPVSPIPSPSMPSDPVDPSSEEFEPVPLSPVSPMPSPSRPSDPVDPSPKDVIPAPPVPVKPGIHPDPGIRAVVPQLPTYLLLPNALFYVGLMDLITQNKNLDIMRNTFRNSLTSGEDSPFFVRGYGGSHHYVSNLSAFKYGYGADLDYNALEVSVLLEAIENLYGRTSFGVMGSYGNLSLYPRRVKQSKKSSFDKWSVAAYGNMQDDTGLYMDGLLSYGLFRGDVWTLTRGKTATLKGKLLNISLTSGKAFTIKHKGLVFDPQVQFIYQNLQFDRVRDIDNLDVDMGKFKQLTVRIGERLTKILSASKEDHAVSVYSKLYFSHSFGDRQFVSFKKGFQLGAFGSFLEAGLGFNARLFSKIIFYGDIAYQKQLTKAGFSGTNFSAGLRYFF